MEFTSRGNNKVMPAQSGDGAAAPPPRRKHIDWRIRSVRIELFILLLGSALLLAAISLYLGFSSTANQEYKNYVDTGKYQAVFLNGGTTSGSVLYSTYFGRITKINDKYFVLRDIYYLTSADAGNGQATPQLTKLGCQQLHSPYDTMIINRNQVAFWENLKDDGKVVQAIKTFQKQNPNGPNCSAASSSTNQNSNTGTQNSAGTSGTPGAQNQSTTTSSSSGGTTR